MEVERNRIIYLAGLFDGEGSFNIQVVIKEHKGIRRVAFTPKLSMTLLYGCQVLSLLRSAFGGNIYKYADGAQRWNLGNRDCVCKAAHALKPHLVINRDICDRYIHALGLFPRKRNDRWNGQRSWTKKLVLEVAEIALTLNPLCDSKKARNIEALQLVRTVCDEDYLV